MRQRNRVRPVHDQMSRAGHNGQTNTIHPQSPRCMRDSDWTGQQARSAVAEIAATVITPAVYSMASGQFAGSLGDEPVGRETQ